MSNGKHEIVRREKNIFGENGSSKLIIDKGLPFSTYAPRGRERGQVSYTFPLSITCKKGGRTLGGPDSM